MAKSPKKPTASLSESADSTSERKAELEIRLLEQQLTPAYRRRQNLATVAGASGLIIACVTVIGGLLSVAGWFIQQGRDREIRIEERMAKVLSLVSEERPAQRAAAVSALQSFLTPSNENRNTQVLVSIANALAIEGSDPVRNAMLSFFEELDPTVVGQNALNLSLRSFAHNSRALVRQLDLFNARPKNLYQIDGPIRVMAGAMVILLHKGARFEDLSGVYLGLSDLRGLKLPRINLNDSILAGSDFTGSTLTGTSFDGADLEGTLFVGADLQSAKFTFQERRTAPRRSYVDLQMYRSGDGISISLPCADLRDANFSGHVLFGFIRNSLHDTDKVNFSWPNFQGANLAKADLTQIRVFIIKEREARSNQGQALPSTDLGFAQSGEFLVGIQQVDADKMLGPAFSDYTKSLDYIKTAFYFSNWSSAKLPRFVANFLTEEKVSESLKDLSEPIFPGAEQCKPRNPW